MRHPNLTNDIYENGLNTPIVYTEYNGRKYNKKGTGYFYTQYNALFQIYSAYYNVK